MPMSMYMYPAALANGAGPEVSGDVLENVMRKAHRATIIPKTKFIRFRTHKHRFGTGVNVVWGIKPKAHAGPRGGVVYVHALTFDRNLFSPRQARAWLKAHGYRPISFEAVAPAVERRVAARRARVANFLPEGAAWHYMAPNPRVVKNATKQIRAHVTATKKFMNAWAKAQALAKKTNRMLNQAVPALKRPPGPPMVRIPVQHPGITRLPQGAWRSWSVAQLVSHFEKLSRWIGSKAVAKAITNIRVWNKYRAPELSAKAADVFSRLRRSAGYRAGLSARTRARLNPMQLAPYCGCPVAAMLMKQSGRGRAKRTGKNPSLMILSNPKGDNGSKEAKLAEKAYKRFHFTTPKKEQKRKVPDGWPRRYVVLGSVDSFEVQDGGGKKVKRSYAGKRPVLATSSEMKDVFIFGDRSLGIPSGVAVRIDYSVPPHSGRNKWARRWWHPHDSHPAVRVHNSGKAVRISGSGLSVTPRGIVG